jgi:NADH:ubiquinone oxidoreductase subunit E
MPAGLDEKMRELVKTIDRYSAEPGQLIGILREAQDIFGYLPEKVQTCIAWRMSIPVSEVNGVVTFYSFFDTRPKGRRLLNVCMGTACYVKGAQAIFDAFKSHLGIDEGETTADGLFTLKSTRCIGACGLAPVVVDGTEVHGRFTAGGVSELLGQKRTGDHAAGGAGGRE